MTKTVSKIAYLDGIRGVAAFCVFVHHFTLAFYSAYYTFDPNASHLHGLEIKYGKSVLSVFTAGHFCVFVFFVLSGFVLSRKYFRSNDYELLISGTYRRFPRLFIPVAATIIISYILLKAGAYFNMPVASITHSEWWLGGLWHIPHPFSSMLESLKRGTMFQNDATFDTSLWTMSIEFTGSLFVFAFLALTHRTRHRFVSLLLVLLYCKVTENDTLSTFTFGIGLNYIEVKSTGHRKTLTNIAAISMLAVALVLGSLPATPDFKGTVFEHVPKIIMDSSSWFHAVGAFLLVAAFVISGLLQRLISLRMFRFLGYISFALYLLHPLLIGSLSCYLFLHMYQPFGYNHSVVYIFCITTVVCFILSWLMAKYIDEPGIRFSKYVYTRWFKKNTPQPALTQAENE